MHPFDLWKSGQEVSFEIIEPCKACGVTLGYLRTKNNRRMPIDVMRNEVHWGKCPEADKFRKGKK